MVQLSQLSNQVKNQTYLEGTSGDGVPVANSSKRTRTPNLESVRGIGWIDGTGVLQKLPVAIRARLLGCFEQLTGLNVPCAS